jgi:hypothetical protein
MRGNNENAKIVLHTRDIAEEAVVAAAVAMAVDADV